MATPLQLPPVEAYHGDTTEIATGTRITSISEEETATTTTARLQVRAAGRGELLVEIAPVVLESTLGTVELAPVTLTPAHWASIPRTADCLEFDLEVTHPLLGTLTFLRGTVNVTLDVTYTEPT